jgi:FAD/FMN-containing dehydrogenase
MIDAGRVRRVAAGLEGRVIVPGDVQYEAARHCWNRLYDRRPALIARCVSPDDVIRAIEFARSNDLPTAVRSGGHSHAGHSTCEGGIVIDLGPMCAIAVNPERQTVSAGPGARNQELNQATVAHGLALTLGTCPEVAIGGLTIAGGEGDLMGKFGLTCDSLIAADVVTADGRRLVASNRENDDLFWAIRGGHGNFGVVTSLTFRLHPVDRVLRGVLTYPASRTREVLRFYRDFVRAIPDELTTSAGVMPLSEGRVFAISACYCGELGEGERVLAPLRSFGHPAADTIRAVSYLESQLDAYVAPAERANFQKSGFLDELGDSFIGTMAAHLPAAPPDSVAMMNHLHGATARVGSAQTAFSLRREGFDFWIAADWQDPALAQSGIRWVEECWKEIEPLTSGAYVGGIGEESPARVRFAYGANYPRLAALKRKYDPDNFFRLNQNISAP